MDAKQVVLRNKQRERQQRGSDFQEEIRDSWKLVPNVWRRRLKDGRGSTQPADEVTLTNTINILAELKRTKGTKFQLSFLEPDQIQGLIDFDEVIERNYGLVFISFHNESKEIDKAYAIRLITALKFMKRHERLHITLEELRSKTVPNVELLRLGTDTYDLKGVIDCYKSL